MRILLVVPHQQVKYKPSIDLPLGVLSIASYLRTHSDYIDVDIYDANLSGKLWTDGEGRQFLGDRPEEIQKRLEEFKPDIVGISNMFTWQIDQALLVARLCKHANPAIITVIGGPHVSSFPLDSIKEKNIDYVVMGEGEIRFLELVKVIASGEAHNIQGVIRDESDLNLLKPSKRSPIRFIPQLDELPIPAYDMVDVECYFQLQAKGFSSRPRSKGRRSVSMITSRGCPHQCIFCSIQATMGYKWRYHSPEYVQEHINYLLEHYDIDYLHFEDDNFTHDPERYDSIIDNLMSLPKRLKWDTPNGIRGDTWTNDRIRKTKLSGCQYLIVAIESGVQEVLDNVVKKRLDLSQVDKLMEACKTYDIRLFAFYVVGLPGETLKDIQNTFNYALEKFDRYDVLPTINKTKTLPGTELYDIVHSNRYYNEELSYDENTIVTDEFDPSAIDRLYNEFFMKLIVVILRKTVMQPSMLFTFMRIAFGYRWFLSRMIINVLQTIIPFPRFRRLLKSMS